MPNTRQEAGLTGLSLAPWNVLAQLAPDDLAMLTETAKVRRVRKGDFVFRSGEDAGSVYFLKTGKIKVTQPAASGKEVILWFCFDGDMFGFAETAQHREREVSAQACEDAEVLSISQTRFNAFLFEHPKVMYLLLQVMASRLRCLSETLAALAGDQVSTRIARLMLWLCARYGRVSTRGVVMDIHFTHQEIADMIGTTRQTVTSVMSELKRDGILESHERQIHIVDKPRLAALLH